MRCGASRSSRSSSSLTGFPLAYYAARYNIDLDLITRGSGFGYYGSVVTNVIFATFTFIFFALEGSIMAQGLKLGLGIPLPVGYAASTLIIFPLVIYGMKVLSTLQVWTTPLWLILMVAPFVYLRRQPPRLGRPVLRLPGRERRGAPNLGSIAAGRRRLPVADRPDRRADRLPALHAAADAGELAQLVDVDVPGRPGLGDLRRDQADRRAVPGGLPDRQCRRRRGDRQPAGAPVPGDLPRTSCRAGSP